MRFLWLLGGDWTVGGSRVDPRLCSTPGNVASGVIAAATCPSSVFIPVSLFPGAMKQLLTLQEVF